MAIKLLKINDFRSFATAEFSPTVNGLNILTGNNGSGKTSLLEAIYYLGHGRSFRTANSNRMIRDQTAKFSIYSQMMSEITLTLGVEREINGQTKQKLSEENVNFTEIANYLPIRLINSQSHQLFESGPQFRRKYLDWGLFYHFENFFQCWRNYERALKQRNSILKDHRVKAELASWTEALAQYGTEFDAFRKDYVSALKPIFLETLNDLIEIDELEIEYLPGWDQSKNLAEALEENTASDYAMGYTQIGPHRADLNIKINGLSAKHFLSRGQQKLMICAMIIAQGIMYFNHINKGLIYLIDDLPAELDLQSKTNLIAQLAKQKMQVFITAIEKEMICSACETLDTKYAVFHVEHGTLRNAE